MAHREAATVTYYSQAGQDEWAHSIVGDTGYFVDIGSHDGVVHSNTYALEKLGWTGICVEPNLDTYETLRSNRSCRTEAVAISDHNGMVGFDGVRVTPNVPWARCRTLTDLLDAVEAPDVIDYLSVDVEGHELEVLAGMDFDRWQVRLITIEHNLYCDGPDRKDAIYQALTGHHGFERMEEDVVAEGYGPYEDWYLNVH